LKGYSPFLSSSIIPSFLASLIIINDNIFSASVLFPSKIVKICRHRSNDPKPLSWRLKACSKYLSSVY
jgi:hypothetical protein